MSDKSSEWAERSAELKEDPHLRRQVKRLMKPLRLIQGERDAQSYEEVVDAAAQLVALLEVKPELQQTANVGGLMAVRGPMQGYSLMLHATDVYVMHLGSHSLRESGVNHEWDKAQQYWRDGEEARGRA